MMTNKKEGTLYIGVTSDLQKRVWEHKNNVVQGFTHKYNLHKLVWYEVFENITDAIVKEKQMKEWKREWKINRITYNNPDWDDLFEYICK